jgi:hypothetical protein
MLRPQTDVGWRILALMEANDFDGPTDFGRVIECSQGRISNVVSGTKPLGLEMAKIIVKHFPKIGLDWLYYGEPSSVRTAELERKFREFEVSKRTKLFRR